MQHKAQGVSICSLSPIVSAPTRAPRRACTARGVRRSRAAMHERAELHANAGRGVCGLTICAPLQGSMSAYAPDCEFSDPFVSFKGTTRFQQNVGNLGGLM